MGVLFLFDEKVPRRSGTDSSVFCTVEVADNHGIPEIRVGPVDSAHEGWTAKFEDWAQYERFVEAVNGLESRLERVKKKS